MNTHTHTLLDVMTGEEKRTSVRVSKPLMERRRRARINACLVELRALLLQSHVTQDTRPSKLEKADILELTVQHLRSLQHTHTGGAGPLSVCYRVCVCGLRCFLTAGPHTLHRPALTTPTALTTPPDTPLHHHHHHPRVSTLEHQAAERSSVWRPW